MPRIKKKPKRTPLWGGPEEEGITQSLLGRWLSCKERFRLLVVEGLKPADCFNHNLEYGNFWHLAEEINAAGNPEWLLHLQSYCKELMQKYRTEQAQVEKWYNVCRIQFPIYLKYWAKHPDVLERTPLLQEEVFCVPYTLPSGRVVKLKGKWDSVDLIGKGKDAGIYLQENKTKANVDDAQLVRQLGFDLQTMIYLIALQDGKDWGEPIKGVRYNVIRRPLGGGKGNIRQHKPTKSKPEGESSEEYYNRLSAIVEEQPEYFFKRWKVEVIQSDIKKFKREFLNPILEQLCDWWDVVSGLYERGDDAFADTDSYVHSRTPYGIYSTLLLDRTGEMDEYLSTGSTVGLDKTTNLFPEL